ncbi:MAG: hypothetical protein IAB16_04315 [Firmicutes bacterium]|uniref:DUF998 domain-containing protein n=1 Tax=Candidatus Stercoripulliclostridium pullicola TaxID=2840953 RepID=A0A940DGX2_9FIRM|nr:hypothetical protein [Candidatus Stercoripulliclostridium pullicola]
MDVNKKVTEVEEVAAGDVAVADGAAPSEKRADKADIREKIFKYTAMVLLIGSFIYFTVYGFLSNPFLPSGTASEIGLKYPTAFKFWGFTTSLALTVNLVYTYTRKPLSKKAASIAGYVCMGLGVACLMTCVHIPSTREPGLQMYAHWSTALLFAVFFAAAIVLHLIFPPKPNKKYKIALICFCALLGVIVIALLAAGKNGFIESLPMWAAYIIIFLDNFTPALTVKD